MQRDRSQFTQADYDFSELKSESELEACTWYEYARESREAMNEIASVRKERKQRKGKPGPINFGPRVQKRIQGYILTFLSLCGGFPNTPWQRLSEKDKQPVLKMVVAYPSMLRFFETWQKPPLLFAPKEPGTTTLDMWKQELLNGRPPLPEGEPVKYGFFAVNLKYGHSVLIEEFSEWLRNFEGKAMVEFPPVSKKSVKSKPAGRKGIHDGLNALGVMRLRYYCGTFSEAKKLMEPLKVKSKGLFYERADNASRACNLAMRNFQNRFGWLGSVKPIPFTKSWRVGPQK